MWHVRVVPRCRRRRLLVLSGERLRGVHQRKETSTCSSRAQGGAGPRCAVPGVQRPGDHLEGQ